MNILEKANSFYKEYTKTDSWETAIFTNVKRMENDTRGRFGEYCIRSSSFK